MLITDLHIDMDLTSDQIKQAQYGTGVDLEANTIVFRFSSGNAFNLAVEMSEEEAESLRSHLARRIAKLKDHNASKKAEASKGPFCEGCGD